MSIQSRFYLQATQHYIRGEFKDEKVIIIGHNINVYR